MYIIELKKLLQYWKTCCLDFLLINAHFCLPTPMPLGSTDLLQFKHLQVNAWYSRVSNILFKFPPTSCPSGPISSYDPLRGSGGLCLANSYRKPKWSTLVPRSLRACQPPATNLICLSLPLDCDLPKVKGTRVPQRKQHLFWHPGSKYLVLI